MGGKKYLPPLIPFFSENFHTCPGGEAEMRTALVLRKEKAVHSSVRGEVASVLLPFRQGELESLSWGERYSNEPTA